MTKEELDKLAEYAFDADNQKRLSKTAGLTYLKQLHQEIKNSSSSDDFVYTMQIKRKDLLELSGPSMSYGNSPQGFLSLGTPSETKELFERENLIIKLTYVNDPDFVSFSINNVIKQDSTNSYFFYITYYGISGQLLQYRVSGNVVTEIWTTGSTLTKLS